MVSIITSGKSTCASVSFIKHHIAKIASLSAVVRPLFRDAFEGTKLSNFIVNGR